MNDKSTTGRSESGDSIDAELAAIKGVTDALEGLAPLTRDRVLQYVFKRLGLGSSPTTERVTTLDPGTSGNQTLAPLMHNLEDIRTLTAKKQPRSSVEMAVLVAYYLAEIAAGQERKAEIEISDVNKYFKQADFPIPSAPRQTLFNAKAAGYLDSAARGAYRLNPVGHNLIAHGLPATGVDPSKPMQARNTTKAKRKSKHAARARKKISRRSRK